MQTASPPVPTPAPAKSRKRWYLVGAFLLLLFAIPFGFYVVSGWWNDRALNEIYRELDAEDPNWRWHDLIAEFKPPPDEQNSAVQVKKVQVLLKKTPFNPGMKWENAEDWSIHRNARLRVELAEILRTAFKNLDPQILDEARKVKDFPNGGFALEPVENPFFDLKLDYAQEARSVVYLLQSDAVLRGNQGEHDEALESCQAILCTGRSLKNQPFLISQLVRMAIQAVAHGAVERTLAQGVAQEENLLKLQVLLELELADDSMHQAMRGERAGGEQVYQLLREGKVTLSQIMNGMTTPPSGLDRLIDVAPGFILGGYPDYLRIMNDQVRASKLENAERADAMQAVEEKVRKKRTILSNIIMPATIKVAIASQRTQALLRCTVVAVAAERYRLKQMHWPRSLDELVKAGMLRDIPKDPYDGQPLRLKRTQSGLIVYSIGPDKLDNGGTFDQKNMIAPNTDLGFELWEPQLRGVPAPPPAPEG